MFNDIIIHQKKLTGTGTSALEYVLKRTGYYAIESRSNNDVDVYLQSPSFNSNIPITIKRNGVKLLPKLSSDNAYNKIWLSGLSGDFVYVYVSENKFPDSFFQEKEVSGYLTDIGFPFEFHSTVDLTKDFFGDLGYYAKYLSVISPSVDCTVKIKLREDTTAIGSITKIFYVPAGSSWSFPESGEFAEIDQFYISKPALDTTNYVYGEAY